MQKKSILFYLALAFIYSCMTQPMNNANESMMTPFVNHIPDLTVLDLDSSLFSYPWYMVKHSGGFENTLGEEITAKDTVHLIYNTAAWVEGDFGKYRLPFCEINLENDTLLIRLFKKDASGFESLKISIHHGEYDMDYGVNHIMACNSNMNNGATFIALNKIDFVKGDVLKGAFSIELEENISCEQGTENKTIKKLIAGEFTAIIM